MTRVKRIGGMAQAIECLSSKHKVLSSKPNTARKKNFLGDSKRQQSFGNSSKITFKD
jgi:hypothetical protein